MKKLIVANWKMNPQTLKEAKVLFKSIKNWTIKNSNIFKKIEIVICPPFVYLPLFKNTNRGQTLIKIGAQNCFWEEKGAFTGEVSPKMLKDLGCEYVILGHSERRNLGENDEMINKKLKAVFKAKLKPIFCIGEKEKERKSGKTKIILKNQLKNALRGILNFNFRAPDLILAYEPVWAIGTGNPCKAQDAKEILIFLRKIFPKNQILYGGSVNSEIAKDYLEIGFNGLLVGSASLNSKEFVEILKNSSNC